MAAACFRARLARAPSPAGERTARVLAGYRRSAGDRGRGQTRPFGAADLAAVLATCHRPRRRGRGVESDPVARERGRLDAVIAGLLFMAGMRRSEVSALPARAAGLASHRGPRPARPHPAEDPRLLAAAKRAGPAISTICDHIHRHDGAAGVRRILGVLSLARKHGPAVAEEAANAALELGVPTYRFLRRYLDRRPAAPLSLRQVDPLIRQLTLYRDLIDRRAGDPS